MGYAYAVGKFGGVETLRLVFDDFDLKAFGLFPRMSRYE
jgi:hypothetical protein